MTDVTRILESLEAGDRQAAGELLPLVYEELRQLASARMRGERAGHTLNATALVHEAYLRLVGRDDPGWEGRGHFFAAAAEAMRRILVDSARRRQALKRGGDGKRVPLEEAEPTIIVPAEDLLAVNEALDDLEREDERSASVVKLHYFTGMTLKETADALGRSPRSIQRDWTFAKAWLRDRLSSR